MNILKPLFVGTALSLSAALHAEMLTYLTLYFNEGATAYINVTGSTIDRVGQSYMKIGPEALTVTVLKYDDPDENYTYEATDLNYFTFEQHDSSALSELTTDAKTRIMAVGNGLIEVVGADCAATAVYDLSGRRLNVTTVKGESSLTISLAGLPAGVYIIACPTAQLKVTKK